MKNWTRDEKLHYLRAQGLSEIHRHFDGSIRPQTLWNLSQKYYSAIPGMDFEGFTRLLSWDKEHDRSLLDYLDKFHVPLQYTQFYDNIRTISFEICEDAYRDGVRILELRINPVIHRRAGLTNRQVLNSVRVGMKDAVARYPDLKVGITVIAIRGHGGNMAKILLREVVGELAAYHETLGVVGFDIAGAERPFPPILFKDAYALARKMGLAAHRPCRRGLGPRERLVGGGRPGGGADRSRGVRGQGPGADAAAGRATGSPWRCVSPPTCRPGRWRRLANIPCGGSWRPECRSPWPATTPPFRATTLTEEYLLAIDSSSSPRRRWICSSKRSRRQFHRRRGDRPDRGAHGEGVVGCPTSSSPRNSFAAARGSSRFSAMRTGCGSCFSWPRAGNAR